VKLASKKEEDLIHRLAQLKTQDADLNVYIALGGWSYNDPGPTQTTFSDLARSEDAQKKFFRSLISFLSTYNLDGVDVDWEYPGPHDIVDRGGREEDFENFPVFLRRLKQALKSTGGRDGVTITLPASYWFLQHFDIVELEKHVDFFNIMSYDLHGAWDKGNKWLGPYLNAHTNLTEIGTALDLLWRNKISSEKVVLGTAFYGRAFAATSTDCLEPGCTFESAATMGSCSRENGILLNSEIMEILETRGVTPTLDKKAGVKIATWENQWVSYDDEETLELKAQYALGLGLGGVMVWAVSHDTHDLRFTNSFFRRAANRNGLTTTTESNSTRFVEIHKTIDQCKWTNCGQTCPAGWQPAPRLDKNAKKDELMLDGTGCDGDLHTLCCPEEAMATCGWYIHTNSFCDYRCPRDFVEVGSTDGGCHSGYQAACCRVTSNPIHAWTLSSMELWSQCEWLGDRAALKKDPECGLLCPSEQKMTVLRSLEGSGAVTCEEQTARPFCCKDEDQSPANHWIGGKWEGYQGTDRDRCSSDCAWDLYRLGMMQGGPCEDKPGAMAFCSQNGHYDTEWEERGNVTELKEALDIFFNNPQCPNDQSGGLITRALTVSKSHNLVDKMLSAILAAYIYDKTLVADYRDIWNEVVEVHDLSHLMFPDLFTTLREMFGNIYEDLAAVKEAIMCFFEELNDLASDNPVLSCEVTDPCEDEDSDCESEEWDDPCSEAEDLQAKRGIERRYCMKSKGTTMRSRRYRSTGQVASTDPLRTRVMVLRSRRDCGNTAIRQTSMPTGNQVDGQLIHGMAVPAPLILLSSHSSSLLTKFKPSGTCPRDEYRVYFARRPGSWPARRGPSECLHADPRGVHRRRVDKWESDGP
jgi:GH18 family chitinase